MTRLWPQITEAERAAVLRVLDSGVLSGANAPEIKLLEKEFAEFLGIRHCLSTNSRTSALHIAVAAAGIEPGDEVITSSFTFLASALAVLYHNAIGAAASAEEGKFLIAHATEALVRALRDVKNDQATLEIQEEN